MNYTYFTCIRVHHKNMVVHLKGDTFVGIFAEILLKTGDRHFPRFHNEITVLSDFGIGVSFLLEQISRIYLDIINIKEKPTE